MKCSYLNGTDSNPAELDRDQTTTAQDKEKSNSWQTDAWAKALVLL